MTEKPVIQDVSDFFTKLQAQEQSEGAPSSEALAQIAKLFGEYFNTDRIDEKTELSERDILTFTKLRIYSQAIKKMFNYEQPYIEPFIQYIMHMRVSKERKGRSEVIKSLEALALLNQQEAERQGLLADLFSRKVNTEV